MWTKRMPTKGLGPCSNYTNLFCTPVSYSTESWGMLCGGYILYMTTEQGIDDGGNDGENTEEGMQYLLIRMSLCVLGNRSGTESRRMK